MKALVVYKLVEAVDTSKLKEVLEEAKFTPCSSMQLKSFGFSETFDEELVSEVNGFSIMKFSTSEKKPNNAEVNRRVKALSDLYEVQTGNKASKKLLQEYKDEVISELLPLTFPNETKHQTVFLYGDLLYVEATSFSKAEDITSVLRSLLGTLNIQPLDTVNIASDELQRLVSTNYSEVLELGEKALLSTSEEREWKGKGSVYNSEAQDLIKDGASVSEVELVHDGVVTFTLTDELLFKGIKFDKLLFEDYEDGDEAGTQLLMVEEVRKLVDCVVTEFGGIN